MVGDTEAFFTVVVVTAGWVEVPAELELAAAELVDEIADQLDHFKVTTFAVASYIVILADAPRANHLQKRLGVIFDVKPIPDVLTVAIDGERFAFQRVDDH